MFSGRRNKLQLAGTILLMVVGIPATLANTLQEVNYSALPGGKVQITLVTSEPVGETSSFATDNPARIAIDLPGTSSALENKTKTVGSGVARSVTAIEAGDKTRVVINLLNSVPYDIRNDGNMVVITLSSSAESGVAPAAVAVASAPAMSWEGGDANQSIMAVDFRRGTDNEGRIEILLSSPNVVVDMRQQGEQILLDFYNAGLSSGLARTLDVTDFATPVQSIETRPAGRNVKMAITATGDFEHLAYQANNVYTVEFRPLSKQQKEKLRREQKIYTGDRLSLNFQDIEVRSVLQLLADFTGLNMVVSDSVSGRITLRLKNVPWDQAMDIILKTKGLSMRRNDNVVLVAPTEEIAAREKLELESQQQIEELAPLRSELVQINYAKAADLALLLKSEENRLLTPRGNVTVDVRTNTLLLQDTASKLAELRTLMERLDIPVRQVLVESRVVIANDDYARDLGVRLGFAHGGSIGDSSTLFSGGQPGHLFGTSTVVPGIENPVGTPELPGPEALLVNLPQTLSATRGGSFNFLVGKLGTYLLQLELSAMQQEGKGEVVSSPRVITSDSKKAIIKQGVEIPYQEATSSGATNVEFKEAVLMLEVTPHITPDDRVIMELLVTKDNPDFTRQVLGVPPVDTRSVETTVLVDNGETVVLGGVFERTREINSEKIPFLGDLPYMGWMFRQKLTRDNNKELLIFVTPKILKETMTLR